MRLRAFLIALIMLVVEGPAVAQRLFSPNKISQVVQYIERFYVEDQDMDKIMDKGIESMLQELDPHSVYIPKSDVQKANEPLDGSFVGVGIAFQLVKDTINVVEVIHGGPAEKVGLLPGDKVVKVDDNPSVGDSITNKWVYDHLRGKKNTRVKLGIKRGGANNLIDFDILRDEVPINSVNTYFMIDKEVGYIALSRFSRTSANEVRDAIADLKTQGMQSLIFDLRSNSGGFLDIAAEIVDEFLPNNQLIVYTEGKSHDRQVLKSTAKGSFETGRLVVLIDEYSASASEIVSGAVQDHDRGIIIGRRSFGKGLVQRMFPTVDGGQMRLTTSRYYTPSGRCIQKPYNDGLKAYYNDIMNRYNEKELMDPAKVQIPDSLKYYTDNKRVVYGGGGILPDILVPIDTTRASDYYINLRAKNLITNFALEYTAANRNDLLQKYPTYNDFHKNYRRLNIDELFDKYVADAGVKKTTLKPEWVIKWVGEALKAETKDTISPIESEDYSDMAKQLLSNPDLMKEVLKKAEAEDKKSKAIVKNSDEYIHVTIKALIARNLYGMRYFYEAMAEKDKGYNVAIDVVRDEKMFKRLNIKE